MTRIQIPPIDFHGGQQAVITHPARFKVVAAGRRFGKTMLAVEWLALYDDGKSAIEGGSVAFFAPTYKLLADVWADMERTLAPVTRKANKTEQRIELITGGKIDFWTLEDPDAGRGRKYHKIVIDEAAHARYLKDAWEQAISPTLTDYRGQAWFISTPKGLNYFHELFQRGQDPAYPEWASFHMPSTTNPYIPHGEIETKRCEIPELVFRQEYLAEFVVMGAGLIKPEMIVTTPCPPGLPVVLGVDLAISEKEGADFTAIVAMARDPESGLVYVKEVERFRAGFHEVLERIKAAAARHKPRMIAVEQVQFQAAVVQELARTTLLPVRGVRADRDKVTRFAPLLTRFEQHLVRLDPFGCPAVFREELLAFPEGKHDDMVDAASHAFAALGMAVGGYATAGTRVF
ncbi:MAG: phage terminase large subunit [Rhodocyclaceae bacterium]|nr:phage terminase large subunit [Rhodocyclaceae bacterium]